jgi:hypothetical protein
MPRNNALLFIGYESLLRRNEKPRSFVVSDPIGNNTTYPLYSLYPPVDDTYHISTFALHSVVR